MELARIETLLLQEMEDVKGGLAGVCYCDSGAVTVVRAAAHVCVQKEEQE